MKNSFKFYVLLFVGLGLLTFASCSDDDGDGDINQNDPTIVDLAVGSTDLSVLVTALQETGLDATLAGNGPFTVFAPTNDAFAAFLTDNGFSTLDDVPNELLTQVLLNHVVAGEFFSSSLNSGYVPSSSTAGVDGATLSLYIDTSAGVTINGQSDVAIADLDASNGVVHVVDAVIGLPNLVDHALANPNLSNLVTALTAGGNTTFTNLLSLSGPYTVFAPDNNAFAAFNNPSGNDINNILANHVIAGTAAFSSALSNSYVNSLGENPDEDLLSLYINTDSGVVLNGSSSVTTADVVGTNGVIHIVDAVIDIPTVVSFAVADPTFAPLVTALTTATPATDFAGVLSGEGPFTVFAPTDAAFQALLDSNMDWTSVEDIDESLLTAVLNHHVVSGNVRSMDLSDGIMPATLEGDMITINLPGTGDNIADVTDGAGNSGIGIVVVDVQAGNGVIHVLNQVMIPDTMN